MLDTNGSIDDRWVGCHDFFKNRGWNQEKNHGRLHTRILLVAIGKSVWKAVDPATSLPLARSGVLCHFFEKKLKI
jgi:hypothetical protein